MTYGRTHDAATSNVLAWSSQSAHMQHEAEDELAAEADEPPDERIPRNLQNEFKRTTVRKQADNSQSLLTKALHRQSDDEEDDEEEIDITFGFVTAPSRRRSINSNISLTSTVDLTPDTGLTSPARTNTPSPPPPVIQLSRLNLGLSESKPKVTLARATPSTNEKDSPAEKDVRAIAADKLKDPAVEALAKKRCISFACGPKPEAIKPLPSPQPAVSNQKAATASLEKPAQRRTCIKFACPAKPAARSTPPHREQIRVTVPDVVQPSSADGDNSPATVRKFRSPSAARSSRSLTPRRRPSKSPVAVRSKKYLTADTIDLSGDSSRFHEFASDEPQEDDWIRQQVPTAAQRLTINDTLRKENEIRKLGREAEEEALQEEFEDDELENEEDADNADEDDYLDDDVDDPEEDDQSGFGSDDDLSDGYKTDNEIGFADSDEEDEDDELELWTHGQASMLRYSDSTPVGRRPSLGGNRSDSSSSSDAADIKRRSPPSKPRRIKIRPGTPELPDSTDFVCGTLDEDRPLEDAYISCITQKRREKLHLIPQDIDPSFPTSEPEDDEDDAAQESDDHVMIHGEMEDLHHDQDRADRRKKRSNHSSPKRLHSPPPRRPHSPAPKGRGRSPRRLFDRHSPRRLFSPAPSGRQVKSPPASPAQNGARGPIDFQAIAARPGLMHTKSLPRPPALFPHNLKGQRRRQAAYAGVSGHVRGAIDIVKGLEHKRQRRREKYIQKHCNRARKGQVVGKRPEPGKGAQRMRELVAGKNGPNNYVLSI